MYLTFAYQSCELVLQNAQKTAVKKVLRRKMFGGEDALCWLFMGCVVLLAFPVFQAILVSGQRLPIGQGRSQRLVIR